MVTKESKKLQFFPFFRHKSNFITVALRAKRN